MNPQKLHTTPEYFGRILCGCESGDRLGKSGTGLEICGLEGGRRGAGNVDVSPVQSVAGQATNQDARLTNFRDPQPACMQCTTRICMKQE